jgi:hypothetical protein
MRQTVPQRLHSLEARRFDALLAALDAECARFAACYTRETFHEPLDEVLAPCSTAQLEVFCAAMLAWRGWGGYGGLNIPDLEALIEAFRHHNTGALS